MLLHHSKAPFALRKSAFAVSQTVALLLISMAGHAQTSSSVNLNAVDVVGKGSVMLRPSEAAPSSVSLDATSASSTVSDMFVRNFISPIADYSQVLTSTPSGFSYGANGIGLSDAKTTIRGLADGNSVISFDGIPFNDTNGVSHHSWAFFPSQFIGGAVVDRSPGSAATIGQATYGGNFDLKSRILSDQQRTDVTVSAGTWNTQMLNVEYSSGRYGENGDSNFLLNAHNIKSDGYLTYNHQERNGFSGKFEKYLSGDTKLTLFASYLKLNNQTPNTVGVLRSNFNAGATNQLMSNDPTKTDYYGYNFYPGLPSDFEYAGIESTVWDVWKLDNKTYHYSYYNNQHYTWDGKAPATIVTTGASPSGRDKLNSYDTVGDVLRLSRPTELGTLRVGAWYDLAKSKRYTYKSNPLTWTDIAVPEYKENYTTTTTQAYVEHEFVVNERLKITPGIKYASYTHNIDQFADLATVGSLNGAAQINNKATYTDVLPSLSANYKLQPNWALYGQYTYGDQIPSTTVFDVAGGKVSSTPKPTQSKVWQIGTVWNSDDLMLGADYYHMKLDSSYTAVTNANNFVSYVASGQQINEGVEVEGSYRLGGGWSMYSSATVGTFKYADSGKWVAGAPKDTEKLGLNYISGPWKGMLSVARVGSMFQNGNAAGSYETFKIDPVTMTNLFVNYTIKHPDALTKESKVQFAVNDLFNQHKIVAIKAAAGSTAANPSAADVLTVTPGRSMNLTFTTSF
jgi:iron complex outermembrane receptor protein